MIALIAVIAIATAVFVPGTDDLRSTTELAASLPEYREDRPAIERFLAERERR